VVGRGVVAEHRLVGQVGEGDRVECGEGWAAGRAIISGSWKSGVMTRSFPVMGVRIQAMSARPSAMAACWSSHSMRMALTATCGCSVVKA
jgi:hypothetical protein